MRWVPIVLVDAKDSALANPCLLVSLSYLLALLKLIFLELRVSKLFHKSFVWKVALRMMQKLCANMYPVRPLPCDAGAPSEFHRLLNLAAAPHPPQSSPFSCKWRLPNTGGEDTGLGCESVQEWLPLLSLLISCVSM